MSMIKSVISGSTAFLAASCLVTVALADTVDDAYCKTLAAQWSKYRSNHGSGSGPSVTDQHMIACDNPQVQIPQLKKALADAGHSVPNSTPLTIEQRVDALEKKTATLGK